MRIIINKENNFPMFPIDQMLMIGEFNECYRYYGVGGLYYAVLMGWEGSPYRDIEDLYERSNLIIADLKKREFRDPFTKKKSKFSVRKDEAPFNHIHMKGALLVINTFAPVPQIQSYNFLNDQIKKIREKLSKINIDIDNPEKLKIQSTNIKTLTTNLKDMENMRDQARDQLAVIMRQVELCSLNDFIVKVGGSSIDEEIEEDLMDWEDELEEEDRLFEDDDEIIDELAEGGDDGVDFNDEEEETNHEDD